MAIEQDQTSQAADPAQRGERRTGGTGRRGSADQTIDRLRERRGLNKATVALAAKNARVVWAMLAHDEDFRTPAPVPNSA